MAAPKPKTGMSREPSEELERVIGRWDAALNRAEVLTGALVGLMRPVPSYEPRFQHIKCASLSAHELDRCGSKS